MPSMAPPLLYPILSFRMMTKSSHKVYPLHHLLRAVHPEQTLPDFVAILYPSRRLSRTDGLYASDVRPIYRAERDGNL